MPLSRDLMRQKHAAIKARRRKKQLADKLRAMAEQERATLARIRTVLSQIISTGVQQ